MDKTVRLILAALLGAVAAGTAFLVYVVIEMSGVATGEALAFAGVAPAVFFLPSAPFLLSAVRRVRRGWQTVCLALVNAFVCTVLIWVLGW